MNIDVQSYIYCILFFVVRVDEAYSSNYQCLRGVRFFDQVSFSWHQCSICSEPEGSQFGWQCNDCCSEITAPGSNGTSEPGTLTATSKKNFSKLSPISHDNVFTSTTSAPSVLTTSKGWTNVEIGLTVTVCVIAALAFTLIIILIVLKKTKRIGRSSPYRVPAADEDEARNAMKPEENRPTPCTDKEATNPFTSIISVRTL